MIQFYYYFFLDGLVQPPSSSYKIWIFQAFSGFCSPHKGVPLVPVKPRMVPGAKQDLAEFPKEFLCWVDLSPESFRQFFFRGVERELTDVGNPILKAPCFFHLEKPIRSTWKKQSYGQSMTNHVYIIASRVPTLFPFFPHLGEMCESSVAPM